MLKYALLSAAMAMTAPALAQTTPTPAPAAPEAVQAAPATATPQAVPAVDATAAAQHADAPQVASVVDTEFATYDKDANGTLSEPEFAAWMVALKSQTDPKTDANSAATKTWNKAAFAQADTDKSKSLSKGEVTTFLAPPAKS